MAYCLLIGLPYPTRAFVIWKFWKWFILPLSSSVPYLTYFNSLIVVLFSALILVNVHKNQGEHILSDEDRQTTFGNMFSITLETILRTVLIFVFGLLLHYFGPPQATH